MSERVANLSGKDVCPYCEDHGFVEVKTDPWPGADGTAQAPCPHCEKGFRAEFSGAWGRDGYWQGRDHSFVKPAPARGKPVGMPAELLERFERPSAADVLLREMLP